MTNSMFAILMSVVGFAAFFLLANLQEPYTESIFESVVAVNTYTDSGNRFGTGSGFFFDETNPQRIITANHVISGENVAIIKIRTYNSPVEWEAKIVHASSTYDVAVLEVTDPMFLSTEKIRVLQIHDGAPRLSEAAYSVGNPGGLGWVLFKGMVSKVNYTPCCSYPENNVYHLTDANVFQGQSGGPLLDSWGRVIGMNDKLYATEGGGYGVVITSQMLHKVLRDWESGIEPFRLVMGFRSELDLIIRDVNPEYNTCNLRSGDRIKKIKTDIGSKDVRNFIELLPMILQLPVEKNRIYVTVDREGKNIRLTCELVNGQ